LGRGFLQRPKGGGPRDDSAPTYEETIAELSTVLTKDVLPFVKLFRLVSEDNPSNYYMEREWRMYGNLEFDCGRFWLRRQGESGFSAVSGPHL